jgi:hypothetical protein
MSVTSERTTVVFVHSSDGHWHGWLLVAEGNQAQSPLMASSDS